MPAPFNTSGLLSGETLDLQRLQLDSGSNRISASGGLSPRRLPAWTRPQVPAFMEVMVRQPSGVRIEFATDATQIELDVQLTRIQLADNPPRSASFDLVCDGPEAELTGLYERLESAPRARRMADAVTDNTG